MRRMLKEKIIAVCDKKIAKQGQRASASFYAFFKNKNDDPKLLMEAAEWWIKEQELDHFEKAVKVRELVMGGD